MKQTNHLLLLIAGISVSLFSGCNEQNRIMAINDAFDFDVFNDVSYEIIDDGSAISHLDVITSLMAIMKYQAIFYK